MDENMFHKEAVFLNIDATSTDEVLDYVYHKMHDMGYVTEEFAQAVKDREHKYPTGLPGPICDIAVPHTDPEYVTKPFIAVVTTKKGIPFVKMATRDEYLQSKIIFVLGSKTGKYQVKILQTLIRRFIQESEMAAAFLKANDVESCYEMLMEIQNEVVIG